MFGWPVPQVLGWQAAAVLIVRFALAAVEAPGLGAMLGGPNARMRAWEASLRVDLRPKRGPAPGLQLVWSDEFEGESLNSTNWSIHPGCDGVHNNDEKECYTNSEHNVYVDGQGHLVLRVSKDSSTEMPYSSGRVTTLGKAEWTYGRFTVSVRVPSGRGFWPAIWMLPVNDTYGGWPTSGELDIVEVLGKDPSVAYGTAHFGAPWPFNRHRGGPISPPPGTSSRGSFADGSFHKFSMEWTPSDVRWFLNDDEYFSLASRERGWLNSSPWAPAPHWPFDQPFYIIMNIAMGGRWPGDPDPSITQGELEIDYVRVFR